MHQRSRSGSGSWFALVSQLLVLLVVAAMMMVSTHTSALEYVCPTRSYDTLRTGWYRGENQLTVAAVSDSRRFGFLFSRGVVGQVYAQILYVADLDGIAGTDGTPRDVIIVATMANNLYMFDAANAAAVAPLWQRNFGAPRFGQIYVGEGILSTPVIDTATGILYVRSANSDGFKLQALNLRSGATMMGPVVIGAPGFDPTQHIQRPALTLVGNQIYVGFSSRHDTGNYQGWIMAYSKSNLGQVSFFNAAPGGIGNGIWQGGQGFSAPSVNSDIIFAVTGNGPNNPGAGQFSNSVLRLDAVTLRPEGFYAPGNNNDLNAADLDLGGSGLLIIPNYNTGVVSGKDGKLYGLNLNGGAFVLSTATGRGFRPYFVGPVFWQRSDGTKYLFASQGSQPIDKVLVTSNSLAVVQRSNVGLPGVFASVLTMSSNAAGDPASSVLWSNGADGRLRAFSADNLVLIYDSATRDGQSYSFAKFNSPTVARGRVFVPTFDNRILVFGIRSGVSSASRFIGKGNWGKQALIEVQEQDHTKHKL